jgi:phosphotriesterase-related protein
MSRRLALPVVCATGFYWDPYSAAVAQAPVEALRDIMIREVTEGVDGTAIRCGVIKVGTSNQAFTGVEERIFRAAGLASIATGAPVFTHTSKPAQALWHLDTLERAGADLTHVLISHLGAAPDDSLLVEVARRGAFIGIDKVGLRHRTPNSELATLVKSACDKGLENQIILSSDIARKDRLQRYGGHSYSTVFIEFVPLLKELGITQAQLDIFLEANPQRLLHFFPRTADAA